MSVQITTAMVDQFTANFTMLAQQRGSKLRECVTLKSGIVGKRISMDQIGSKVAKKKTTRHSDTEYTDTPHARRWLTLSDYFDADLVDDEDKVRILSDPTSEYMQAIAWALGRSMDDEIISAFTAASVTGQDGTSSVTWAPSAYDGTNGSAQVFIAHDFDEAGTLGDTGLTVSKLRVAKQILDGRDVASSDEEERFIICSPVQITDLLRDEKATSSDYAQVKALVEGKIGQFMGFTFKPLTRTKTVNATYGSGATDEQVCHCYVKSGLSLGIGRDITGRITEMPTKHYSVQAYGSMSIGATRTEEAKVLEIRTQFPAATS